MSDNNNPHVQSHYTPSNGGVTRDTSYAAGANQAYNGYQPSPQQHNESANDYYNRMQGYDANKKK